MKGKGLVGIDLPLAAITLAITIIIVVIIQHVVYVLIKRNIFCHYIYCLFVFLVFVWLCVPVHMTFFFCSCVHEMSVHLCTCVYCPTTFPCSPSPESPEVSVESDASVGGVAIPEISVTGVGGERMANGDSRPRPDGRTHLDGDTGASSEVSLDPRSHDSGSTRSQEVRRQKSLRRMVENESSGLASTGRSQY